MRYDRLITKLFCKPVLLDASTRAGFEMAVLSLMRGDPQASQLFAQIPKLGKVGKEEAAYRTGKILEMRGDTAIIYIEGTIDKNLTAMDRLCIEATDVTDIQSALAQVKRENEMGRITKLLGVFNTPGGSPSGIPETADMIKALCQQMDCFAWVDTCCCSAGEWLASAFDQKFCTPMASIASIGVYLAIIDETKRLEKMGLNIETIKDGELKAAGASWKPLSDAERTHLQAQVSEIGRMFRASILEKRPNVSMSTMQGQSYLGAQGVELGLYDGICNTLEDALAQF